jgi:hypothetical protein
MQIVVAVCIITVTSPDGSIIAYVSDQEVKEASPCVKVTTQVLSSIVGVESSNVALTTKEN